MEERRRRKWSIELRSRTFDNDLDTPTSLEVIDDAVKGRVSNAALLLGVGYN